MQYTYKCDSDKIKTPSEQYKIQSDNRQNRDKIIYMTAHSSLDTGTLIKSGEVKLVLLVQVSPLSAKMPKQSCHM